MKRIRVVIEAEYELPDSVNIVDLPGGHAIDLGEFVVRPEIEFWQLEKSNSTSSQWVAISEPAHDLVVGAERQENVAITHVALAPN